MKYKKNREFMENATNRTVFGEVVGHWAESGGLPDGQVGGPYPATLFQAQLGKLAACAAGRVAVGDKTAREFWNTCENADYLLWLAYVLGCGHYVPPFLSYTADEIRARLSFDTLRAASWNY